MTFWVGFGNVYCSLLFVPAKPYIPADSFPSIYQVAEGKSLLATCITTGNPRPEVSWYYFQPVPGSQLGVKGRYLILNPFKTNEMFHKATYYNKVRMVHVYIERSKVIIKKIYIFLSMMMDFVLNKQCRP